MISMKYFLPILIIFCLCNCLQEPQLRTGLEGRKLPSFPILLMDSVTKLNTDEIKPGDPFVLLYFEPECPYCRAEILDIIKHRSQPDAIKFYLVTDFNYPAVKRLMNEYRLKGNNQITIALDYTRYLPQYFYITNIPFLAIYDKNKRLVRVFTGETDYHKLEEFCSKNL